MFGGRETNLQFLVESLIKEYLYISNIIIYLLLHCVTFDICPTLYVL